MPNHLDSVVTRRISSIRLLAARLRRYQQGLVIAAGVSIGQIGSDPGVSRQQPYAIVRLVNDASEPFNQLERIGNQILTRELHLDESSVSPRLADQLN